MIWVIWREFSMSLTLAPRFLSDHTEYFRHWGGKPRIIPNAEQRGLRVPRFSITSDRRLPPSSTTAVPMKLHQMKSKESEFRQPDYGDQRIIIVY
jgi:hypothetical protein